MEKEENKIDTSKKEMRNWKGICFDEKKKMKKGDEGEFQGSGEEVGRGG